MSRNYYLKSLTESELLVVFTNWERIEYSFKNLIRDLIKLPNIKYVYFDLLVKNGPKDRFYKAVFFTNTSILSNFERIEASKEILHIADQYFKNNVELINNSLLTSTQKSLFKKRLLLV